MTTSTDLSTTGLADSAEAPQLAAGEGAADSQNALADSPRAIRAILAHLVAD